MKKSFFVAFLCLSAIASSLNAQVLKLLDVDVAPEKKGVYMHCGDPKIGILVFSSVIPWLEFTLSMPDSQFGPAKYDTDRNEYVLCVEATTRRYVVMVTCPDCEPTEITVEDVRGGVPQFFRIIRKHTPPERKPARSGELSFYYPGGFENLAAAEHGDIPIDVVLRQIIKKTENYTDRNGKAQTRTTTEYDDKVIASCTLLEGFSVKINDPRSDQYEVIIKVQSGFLGALLPRELLLGEKKVGDAVIKFKTEKLRASMPKRDFEYILEKKSEKEKKKGNIIYNYAFVVK